MVYVFSLTGEAEGEMREEKRSGDMNYKQQKLDTSSRAADSPQQPRPLPAVSPQTFIEGLNRNPPQPHDRLTDSAWSRSLTHKHTNPQTLKHLTYTQIFTHRFTDSTEIALVWGITINTISSTYITL